MPDLLRAQSAECHLRPCHAGRDCLLPRPALFSKRKSTTNERDTIGDRGGPGGRTTTPNPTYSTIRREDPPPPHFTTHTHTYPHERQFHHAQLLSRATLLRGRANLHPRAPSVRQLLSNFTPPFIRTGHSIRTNTGVAARTTNTRPIPSRSPTQAITAGVS